MGKNGLSLRSSPNRPARLCQTSFARTLALGLLSPSLQQKAFATPFPRADST